MIEARPNLSALVAAARHAAQAMHQNAPPDDQLQQFLEELLFQPHTEGGRELWTSFIGDLITAEELRSAVLARLATWLALINDVSEPSSEMWCSPALERLFDGGLFVVPGSSARIASLHAFEAAVSCAASEGLVGAVLLIEARGPSVERLPADGGSEPNVSVLLLRASQLAAETLPASLATARTSWRILELALLGMRESLVQSGRALLSLLLAHPQCGRAGWRLVFTRIVPGDARRTRYADPAYDLVSAPASFVAWVEPYPGDDWQASQRYPTTELVYCPERT